MSAYSDLILASPLLVCYAKLDETSGTAAVDSGPLGLNGLYVGSPTLGVTKLADGTAVTFNGSSQYVDMPAPTPTTLWTNGGPFSIEAWITTSFVGSGQHQIACADNNSQRYFQFYVDGPSGLIVLICFGAGSNGAVASNVAVNDGKRHHIVATLDGSKVMRIYVDGVLACTPTGTGLGGFSTNVVKLRIAGRDAFGLFDPLAGTVDEVALYNGPLDQATITTHTTGGTANPPPILIASSPGDPAQSGSLAELRMQLEDGRDLTPLWETADFTTLAVGGFGSLEFALEGWRARDEVPKLMLVRVTYGPELIWEGRIEDVNYLLKGGEPGQPGDKKTLVSCYGLRRLLEDDTERVIYSMRDIAWKPNQAARGYQMGLEFKTKDLDVQIGGFDPTDLTKGGVQIQGGGISVPSAYGNGAEIILPQGMTAKRIRGISVVSGTNTGTGKLVGLVEWSDAISGSFIWVSSIYRGAGPATVDEDLSTPASTIIVRLSGYNEGGGALTPTATDLIQFYNLRILCTSLGEDTTLSTTNLSGGFYGGTLMRQIIAAVAGLKAGSIEDATEFVIDQLERQVRGASLSMIDEVAQYSARQWAVWEDGLFDWKSINFDEPQFVIPVELCMEVDITSSIEGQAKRVVVLYTDPATGLTAEQSVAATDGRNPFVKYAAARDYLLQRDYMTANTAAQLAAKVNANDVGAYTPASGHIVIPALSIIQAANGGGGLPACAIRAGCNVVIPGLPKADPFDTSRDGETLFHVVTSTASLGAGTVTLELENSTRRTEALLARLAAVTSRATRFA